MGNKSRRGTIVRNTRETRIALALGLDGAGASAGRINTSIPFLDHMLTLFAAHGGFDLTVTSTGDLKVDDHHLVEDLGIVLGQALAKALGDKKGIRRYGDAMVPMDESLVLAAIDISGRSHLGYHLEPSEKKIKQFATDLVEEFFLGFIRNVPCTLHIRKLSGGNVHHEVEAAFKSFGQALGAAVERRGIFKGVPSTKGLL